jgi:hypothetical protein
MCVLARIQSRLSLEVCPKSALVIVVWISTLCMDLWPNVCLKQWTCENLLHINMCIHTYIYHNTFMREKAPVACIDIYSHMHTCMHAYIHAYWQKACAHEGVWNQYTRTHIYIHTYMNTHIIYLNACTGGHLWATYTHIYIHAYINKHT